MARFYDDLRRKGEATIEPELQGKLGGATVIDASNLSDYLYANEAKGEWDLLKDFFNLAPPFEKFFVECKAPGQILTKEGMMPWPAHLPKNWGVLFLATDLTRLDNVGRDRMVGWGDGSAPENTRWVLQAIMFAETPPTANGQYNGKLREQFSWWFPVLPDGTQPMGAPRGRSLKIEYVVDSNLSKLDPSLGEPKFTPISKGADRGTMEMTEEMLNFVNIRNVDSSSRFWYPSVKKVELDKQLDEERFNQIKTMPTEGFVKVMSLREDIPAMTPSWQFHYTMVEEQFWLPLLQPCLMAVCFLHVKNIKMERIDPPKALVKKARKFGREPICSYHVLHIQPFKKVLESEGHVSQSGIRKALHICRGHISHYGEQFGKGKLFGKYSGSFYIPPLIRGSIDSGLMDKSYAIDKPKKSA